MNENLLLSLLPLIILICQFISVYEEALVKLKVMIAKYKGEKANSDGFYCRFSSIMLCKMHLN